MGQCSNPKSRPAFLGGMTAGAEVRTVFISRGTLLRAVAAFPLAGMDSPLRGISTPALGSMEESLVSVKAVNSLSSSEMSISLSLSLLSNLAAFCTARRAELAAARRTNIEESVEATETGLTGIGTCFVGVPLAATLAGLLGLGAIAGAVVAAAVDGGGAGRISRSAGGGAYTADCVGRGRGLAGMTEGIRLGAGCMAAILNGA